MGGMYVFVCMCGVCAACGMCGMCGMDQTEEEGRIVGTLPRGGKAGWKLDRQVGVTGR